MKYLCFLSCTKNLTINTTSYISVIHFYVTLQIEKVLFH